MPDWMDGPTPPGRGWIGVAAAVAFMVLVVAALRGCHLPTGKPHFPPRGPLPSTTAHRGGPRG